MNKVAIITSAFGYGLDNREQTYAKVFSEYQLQPWYCSREDLMENPQNVRGVIVGVEKADEEFFTACKNLSIAMKFGVGLDNFDKESAKRLGIHIANLPGINSDAVAELTITLMLCVSRRICTLNEGCKKGGFEQICSHSIMGKTLGIVGLGSIGRKVANIAQSFNLRCIAYDVFPFDVEGVTQVDFPTLLKESDIISIHIPLTPESFHLFDADCFSRMKKGSIIINTSRGGIVDEPALAAAIRDGNISGAGLDVFESRDTVKSLTSLDSVVCTPHVAAYTHETLRHMENTAIKKMAVLLDEELI